MTSASRALFCDLMVVRDLNKERSLWNLEGHVPRRACIIAIPVSLVINTLDILVGTLQGIVSIPFNDYNVVNYSYENLKASQNLLAQPFQYVIHAINPHAINERCEVFVLSQFVNMKIRNQANQLVCSSYAINRHLTARLVHLVRLLPTIVIRVSELGAGIFLGFVAILTLGRYKLINRSAFEYLQGSGVIKDIITIARDIVHPPQP